MVLANVKRQILDDLNQLMEQIMDSQPDGRSLDEIPRALVVQEN